MYRIWFYHAICALTLVSLLAACAPSASELASQTAVVETSIAAAWTPTSKWTPTSTLTSTPTATETATPTSTLTPTATDSPTPLNTATATPSLTPTRTPLPPPTLTFTPSPRPEAPVFAQTHIRAFEANDFRKEIAELAKFDRQFVGTLQYLIDSGSTGSCQGFYNFRNELIVSQAAYHDVPEAYYGLYYQYRVLVHRSVDSVQPITAVCDAGGGTITLEQDLAIIAALTDYAAQADQVLAQASTLP